MCKNLALTIAVIAFFGSGMVEADELHYTQDDFYRVEKIDTHMHIHSVQPAFLQEAQRDRFRILSINVDYADFPPIDEQAQIARSLRQQFPDHFAYAMTFSVSGFEAPGWANTVIARIDQGVQGGAVAVKVWKNIGMDLRDKDGKLVMINDPHFKPIFDHLEKIRLPLLGHQGEPRNCWLPVDQMTVKNDQEYFTSHPQYHMFLHPELPSYEDQMSARDAMLAQHPDMIFVGMHMASLEWSVDELAKFLERFPNASVDLAARIGQLQVQVNQDRDKVLKFLTAYQDRITYGTDLDQEKDDPDFAKEAQKVWLRDWRFFTSNDIIDVPELAQPVKGLALPKALVDKLYRTNAERLYPTAWRASQQN